jgi:hypothetical protein
MDTQDAPIEQPQEQIAEIKPKRVMNEAQLRNLAIGRKKAIEQRQKVGTIAKAKKLEKRTQINEDYTEAVKKIEQIKAKTAPEPEPEPEEEYNEPLQETYDEAPQGYEEPQYEEEEYEEPPPQPVRAPRKTRTTTPNPRDEYYSYKLQCLREQEEQQRAQQNWQMSYRMAPSYVHAYDIARQSLKEKTNKKIYDAAYSSIFQDGM